MERGRYTHYSQRKYPLKQRRIAVPGSFEDSGKFVRCSRCGFILNVDRDMGDGGHSGNYETDVVIAAQSPTGTGSNPIICMDTLSMVGILIENGPDGDPVTDHYTPRIPQVARGCPLCGLTTA